MADNPHAEMLALETLLTGLDEMQLVLGPNARPVLEEVGALFRQAIAARERGDIPKAMALLDDAMDRLGVLADGLDAVEGSIMRAVTESFRTALRRGDEAAAKERAAIMMQRSGAVERKKQE